MIKFTRLPYMASISAVFCTYHIGLPTWEGVIGIYREDHRVAFMVITDGGEVELIAQGYGLCELINFWYQQLWEHYSVDFISHYSKKITSISGKNFSLNRSFSFNSRFWSCDISHQQTTAWLLKNVNGGLPLITRD